MAVPSRDATGSPAHPTHRDATVFWGHATTAERLHALIDLGGRLEAERPRMKRLITYDPWRMDKVPEIPEFDGDVLPLGDDLPGTCRRFLDRWQPDICVWTGGFLRRTLLVQSARRGVPLVLLDGDTAGFQSVRRGIWRSSMASTLDLFSSLLVNSRSAASALAQLGAPPARISVFPKLRSEPTILPCDDTELSDIARDLAGRQVWLAAQVSIEESEAIVQAHQQAVRLAHRLLLVMVPELPEDAPGFRDILQQSGLRWSDDTGTGHREPTQVLLCGDPEDLGIWYRVAPLAYLGCSLWPGLGGRDPMQAAALGAAILSGPNVRSWLSAYERLTAAGAARIVRNPDALGDAVLQLIVPDRSAAMALAAWDVATEGAEAANRALDLVQDLLEMREREDASA